MNTQTNAETQEKIYQRITEDPVNELMKAAAVGAGKLESDGLRIPELFTLGENGPIIILEDRDKHAKVCRGRRFDTADMALVFQHARSVTIIPYGPRKNAPRVGLVAADWQELTLHSRLLDGAAVIVLTTSDRVRHWSTEARTYCRPGAVVEFFDAKGVARVVEGGL